MEFRQLQYFTTIARVGGFRRAADALSVSQAALSQQIKLLERELQVTLFDRGQRSITLTEPGRVLLGRAERALVEIQMAREELLEFTSLERGQVSVGMVSPSGMMWAPRLLAAFKQRYPHIGVTVAERSNEQLLALLRDAKIHVAWLVTPTGDPAPTGMHFEPIFTGELAFAVPAGHRLANQPIATLEELAREPLILPPPGEPVRMIVDRAFRARGFSPTIAVEVADPAIRLELVAEGLGIGVASESSIREAQGRVSLLKLTGERMQYSWVLAWTERGVRTKAVATFVRFSDGQLRAWVTDGVVMTRQGWEVGVEDRPKR